MPTYLTPGVYVEELPAAGAPIEGVGTSVAGFVGLAPGGPVDTPMRITSWGEFARVFGAGGRHWGPFVEGAYLAHAVYGYFQNGGTVCWVARVAPEAGDPPRPTPSAFEGSVELRRGLGGLAAVDEIGMVCIPDLVLLAGDDLAFRDQQGKLIAHCEALGDRMAILDTAPDLLPWEALEWRQQSAEHDSRYAALYYPWLEVIDPVSSRPILVPPSGHVAGVWSRTDARRGVHKAPANESVIGSIGLGFGVSHAEQGALNMSGLNCIRAFPGRGIRIWGARTLSSDPEARYLNVRRLVMHVSEAIVRGTAWAVYEPNDPRLWIQLRVAVANYLVRLWRDGALTGGDPGEAFYVKCDEETNPPEVVGAGQVVIEVGIAPAAPAEFIVFRVSQLSAGGT